MTRTPRLWKEHPRAYKGWAGLKARCLNPRTTYYANYGGRGIGVCDRWLEFGNFLADMGDPPLGTSIDRIDNDGNYEPGNCRWADRKTQAQNARHVVNFTVNGDTKCLREWSEATGLTLGTISKRIKLGWPPESVVSNDKHPGGGSARMNITIRAFDAETGDLIDRRDSTLQQYRADNPNAPPQYAIRDGIRELGAHVAARGRVRTEITKRNGGQRDE